MRAKRLLFWGFVWGTTTLVVAQESVVSFPGVAPTASATTATPGERLLLLKNGGLLRGEIRDESSRVVVRTPGGEVRVPRADVAAVVDDLAGAWAHRRAELDPDSWQGRLDLADWCLRHGLIDEAAELVEEAQKLEPRSGRAARLARVIALKREPPPTTLHTSLPALPRVDDHKAAPLPAAAMEAFVRDVQPLVLNSCATGSCHGGRSQNGLRLLRQVSGRVNTRRATSRNLEALLEHVDRDVPVSSRLLTVLAQGHGGRTGLVVTPAQIELLAAWVGLVTDGRPGGGHAAAVDGIAGREGRSPRAGGRPSIRAGGPSSGPEVLPANAKGSGGSAEETLSESSAEEPSDVSEASREDPLDPSEFNRAAAAEPRDDE